MTDKQIQTTQNKDLQFDDSSQNDYSVTPSMASFNRIKSSHQNK